MARSYNLKTRYGGAALVTGASSGIGAEFARRMAAEGLDVVLVARREDKLRELAAKLEADHSITAHVLAMDLTSPDGAQDIKAALDEKGVEVGVLINNAGFGTYGLFHDLDPAGETRMVDLNCRTPVALTSAFAPGMIERGRGAIIFLSSLGGYQPTPFFATYGATKAFNLMLGEALWAEMKPHGVDVIALSPGFTRTEFQDTAGLKNPKAPTGWKMADEVVETCLSKLGRAPSVVPGFVNNVTTAMARGMPRKLATMISYKFSQPRKG